MSKVIDWSNVLSLGEQQRIAFCRLLLNKLRKLRLVICDEATSALETAAQRKMYELFKTSVPECTRHRPTLMRYHGLRLRVSSKGCDLVTIDDLLFKNL